MARQSDLGGPRRSRGGAVAAVGTVAGVVGEAVAVGVCVARAGGCRLEAASEASDMRASLYRLAQRRKTEKERKNKGEGITAALVRAFNLDHDDIHVVILAMLHRRSVVP